MPAGSPLPGRGSETRAGAGERRGALGLGSWMEAVVLRNSHWAPHAPGARTRPGLTVGAASGARVWQPGLGACTFEVRSPPGVPRGRGASPAGLQFPAMALPFETFSDPLGSVVGHPKG